MRSRRWIAVVLTTAALAGCGTSAQPLDALPLRRVAETTLTGVPVRFDYVVYDPLVDRMVVAVQGRNDLALVDPDRFTVTGRISTPGCDHPHGQALAVKEQVMFIGCESNAAMVSVDLANGVVIDRQAVGATPDVLAYDPDPSRIYVAAESGSLSIFDQAHGHLSDKGSARLADGAHSLALDPTTHHTYFPIPKGPSGSPVLWEFEPTT